MSGEQKSSVRAGASGSVSSGADESAREPARLAHADEPEEGEEGYRCPSCGERYDSKMRTPADRVCFVCRYSYAEDWGE